MIPLDTPPGTEVVFIGFHEDSLACEGRPNPQVGDVSVVVEIRPQARLPSGGGVMVDRYPGVFCLSCFRLLHKPRELYDLLATAPADLWREAEPRS
jgi:hypothetical protein